MATLERLVAACAAGRLPGVSHEMLVPRLFAPLTGDGAGQDRFRRRVRIVLPKKTTHPEQRN